MRWNFSEKYCLSVTFCIFTFQFKGTMMIDQNEIKSAFNHFVMGWHFITQKAYAVLVIMPILLNVVPIYRLILAIRFTNLYDD